MRLDWQGTGADADSNVLMLFGELITFNKGSRSKRYLIGGGTGEAELRGDCYLLDKKTGRQIFRFQAFGETNWGAFRGGAHKTLKGFASRVVSISGLDAFVENPGFWQTVAGLAMHLIPSFLLCAALAFAWRWGWIGAVVSTSRAVFVALVVRAPWWGKAIFAAPCLFAGIALFPQLVGEEGRIRPAH